MVIFDDTGDARKIAERLANSSTPSRRLLMKAATTLANAADVIDMLRMQTAQMECYLRALEYHREHGEWPQDDYVRSPTIN